MYAITIPNPGGPEVLTWTQVDDPIPASHEVLIEVAAAGVNRADLLQRAGVYPSPPGASPYPGLECSGRVVALGSAATQWRLGDEVCALLPGGGYAQLVAAPEAHCLPIPSGVSLVDAAALPEAACTVWASVFELGRLRAADTLLMHGGASGIGTFAIQLAADLGATVITTARAHKLDALRALGASVGIDYVAEDFIAAVCAATDGRGADVICDIIGSTYLGRNVSALATDGRLVVIGLQGGRRAELDLGQLLAKRASVTATALRARPDGEKAALVAAVRERVWPRITAGAVKPVIHDRVPMAQAEQAHRTLAESTHIGKLLLVP